MCVAEIQAYWALYNCFSVCFREPDCFYKLSARITDVATVCMAYRLIYLRLCNSLTVSSLTKLTIKLLPKNIDNIHLMCSYIYSDIRERAVGQYTYCPNHIQGDMNIVLILVSFMVYSGSARHFDPPMQQALSKIQHAILHNHKITILH